MATLTLSRHGNCHGMKFMSTALMATFVLISLAVLLALAVNPRTAHTTARGHTRADEIRRTYDDGLCQGGAEIHYSPVSGRVLIICPLPLETGVCGVIIIKGTETVFDQIVPMESPYAMSIYATDCAQAHGYIQRDGYGPWDAIPQGIADFLRGIGIQPY